MLIVTKGLIGKGMNGMSELIIHTDEDVEFKLKTEDGLISIQGEIVGQDDYFNNAQNGHILRGKRTFYIPRENILLLTDDEFVSN